MTTGTQFQELGAFAQRGFTLEQPDDHTLLLQHDGELVARFGQTGATPSRLQAECAWHLVTKHGWDGCL